jgi:pyruvate dehydrogenase E2 component (dihydrolipoamide acetyltransferase)
METGTVSKWLVKVGDTVKSGDVLAEIETDKATMEVESIDEGVVAELVVAAGTEGVPVVQVIMRLSGEGEVASPLPQAGGEQRVNASPLARRLAEAQGVSLATLTGSGPNGRIVRADIDAAAGKPATSAAPISGAVSAPAAPPVAPAKSPQTPPPTTDIPHEVTKLGNVRKVIARRLTEAKQTIPHIYLTVDVRLDALLKLRTELNTALEPRKIKLSVNDMVIKALALALRQVPKCNVSFAGDNLISYSRADISVAVAAPSGLITPIIVGADSKALSQIAAEMKELAEKARAGKLQPHEYQGGTASVSNLGMYGIKSFDAVINPPQAMILAVGAGEKRPYVVGDALAIATIMSVTGSFDHRAIDGADGAELMSAFKALIENPLGLVA